MTTKPPSDKNDRPASASLSKSFGTLSRRTAERLGKRTGQGLRAEARREEQHHNRGTLLAIHSPSLPGELPACIRLPDCQFWPIPNGPAESFVTGVTVLFQIPCLRSRQAVPDNRAHTQNLILKTCASNGDGRLVPGGPNMIHDQRLLALFTRSAGPAGES